MSYVWLNDLNEKTVSDITTATAELPIANPQFLSQRIAGGWSTILIKDSVNTEVVKIEPLGDKVKMIRTNPKYFQKGACVTWTLTQEGLKETICAAGYCDGEDFNCEECQ